MEYCHLLTPHHCECQGCHDGSRLQIAHRTCRTHRQGVKSELCQAKWGPKFLEKWWPIRRISFLSAEIFRWCNLSKLADVSPKKKMSGNDAKPQMGGPRDLNIGFQGLALIQGQSFPIVVFPSLLPMLLPPVPTGLWACGWKPWWWYLPWGAA